MNGITSLTKSVCLFFYLLKISNANSLELTANDLNSVLRDICTKINITISPLGDIPETLHYQLQTSGTIKFYSNDSSCTNENSQIILTNGSGYFYLKTSTSEKTSIRFIHLLGNFSSFEKSVVVEPKVTTLQYDNTLVRPENYLRVNLSDSNSIDSLFTWSSNDGTFVGSGAGISFLPSKNATSPYLVSVSAQNSTLLISNNFSITASSPSPSARIVIDSVSNVGTTYTITGHINILKLMKLLYTNQVINSIMIAIAQYSAMEHSHSLLT